MLTNKLYSDHAAYYELIANDRDFKHECEWLRSILDKYDCQHDTKSQRKILELFAGPAYHSAFFNKLNFDCFAVDCETNMKEIAVEQKRISADQYQLLMLPHEFNHSIFPKFDLVLIMRYSLGLLDQTNVKKLFNHLALTIKPGGMIAIELHHPDSLKANCADLEIKQRKIYISDRNESITCWWPYGEIIGDISSKIPVTMPIKVEHKKPGEVNIIETYSSEIIYSENDLKIFIANSPLNYITTLSTGPFHQSNLILLQKGNN